MSLGGITARRWLLAPAVRLPRAARYATFAFGLGLLAAVYAATNSDTAQVLVLFVLLSGLVPAVTHRFGVHDELARVTQTANVPGRVVLKSFAVIAPWVALTFFLIPSSLGPWFWSWLVMWPWIELQTVLAERALQRDGAATWRRARILQDSATAGAAIWPVITAILLVDRAPLGEAVLTGALCACVVFGMTATFAWLRRSADQDNNEQRADSV